MLRRTYLFDVDGTLCESQQLISEPTILALQDLSQKVDIGIVSGSNADKVLRQFQVSKPEELAERAGVRYCMFENGVQSFDLREKRVLNEGDIINYLGESRYQDVINLCLRELSEIRLPIKRDLMIETRRGNINVSPIGRACSLAERAEFYAFDQKHNVRKKLAANLTAAFAKAEIPLVCFLGGQISVDISPGMWTKKMVLDLLPGPLESIYFFGDNCATGGNDKPLYDAVIHGYWIKSPADCIDQIKSSLLTSSAKPSSSSTLLV